jgi:alkaline phosphatase D
MTERDPRAAGEGGKLSRRELLRLGGAALGGLIASPWLESCAPILRHPEPEENGLSSGYVVGDVRADEALVWLRTSEVGEVEIHCSKDPSFRDFVATPPVLASPQRDLAVKVALHDLEPATRYFYRAAVAGKAPGPVGEFVTPPAAERIADVRFAFGGDTRQSFRPFRIMDAIRAKRPDFFVYLGDTIYADRDGKARRLAEFWAKYAANREDAPTRRLFARTCCYAVWDDHEVANDYQGRHPLAPTGWRAFLDYWPVREDAREPYRIYRSFRWGKAVELFLLDVRQYRDPQAQTLLGPSQLAWLLEGLAASDAYFKFIATAVPFSSPHRDKWGGFARERDRIVRFIERRDIRNVIFISADLHLAASAKVPGAGLREFVVGPLAAPMGIGVGLPRRCDFVFRETFNYGLVEVAAKANPPYADVVHLDENNGELYRTRIEKL